MRLTLRTLLAYRDGVLSPSETSDLHQRIKKNEFASNLLRRIENLVINKQLLVPKVNGTGLGGDANSVAEYLDDSLASEQIPEFERICIAESDLALAELAHCHQLLAEALNSQVIVPPDLKALAISLTNPQNQAALARRLKVGGAKSSDVAGPVGSIRRVDDGHASKSVVASEGQAKAENAPQRSQVQAPMVTSGGGSIKPQGLDLERQQLAHEVPGYLTGQSSIGGWRIPVAIVAMALLLGLLVWQALGPLKNVRELFVAANLPSNGTTGKSSEPNTQLNGPNASDKAPESSNSAVEKSNAANSVESFVEPNDTLNNAEPVVTTDSVPTSDATKRTDGSSGVPTQSPTDSVDNTICWTPGRDDSQSVLFTRKTGGTIASLNRLASNTPINSDEQLIIPPYMRTTLSLAGQCSWTVCGPSVMQLSLNESVTVNTSLCRGLAQAGPHGRKFSIDAPAGSVELQFEDPSSMAAVEVAVRPVALGAITDKLAFKPVLIIVAVEGQVTVTAIGEGTQPKSFRLVVGEGVAFMDSQSIEFELGAIPVWYRAGSERPLDSLAAMDLHKFISGPDDVSQQLTSLCADLRPETAALAIQAKMLLGDWKEFAGDFLNNELMRSHWSTALDLAEQLIASKESDAEALRAAFEAAHPGRGESLLALLVGDSKSGQSKDLLSGLVELLGSDQLDERVLAAYQLRRLTGKDLGFQPSFPNRAVLQQWRRTILSSPSMQTLGNPIWEAKRPQ